MKAQTSNQLDSIVSSTSRKRTDALPPPPPEAICEHLGIDRITIEWLAGDGSDRCYYRLLSSELDRSLVLMQLSQSDAEKLANNGYEWIQIGQLLQKSGIFVPQTVQTMPKFAALIIEDYGDMMMEAEAKRLLQENDIQSVKDLYHRAVLIIVQMLGIPQSQQASWCQRQFDAERFIWEMNFFAKHYLEGVLALPLTTAQKHQFQQETHRLSTTLAEITPVFVHRDFHSRNIMIRDQKLAILDFQDARLGPPSYDLVSLVFDSYVPLSTTTRQQLLDESLNLIQQEKPQFFESIQASWRPMLLQRQLKAIGSFGYLSRVKNRGRYLQYVPKALETLECHVLADHRWPFLSGELISLMRQRLNEMPTQ
jgi:hypothetical protein